MPAPTRRGSFSPLHSDSWRVPWRQAIAYGYQKSNQRGQAFTDVLGCYLPPLGPAALRTPLIMALALLAAVADVLTPLYAGS